MIDEPDNTPLDEDVTDNVERSEDDNPDDLDYYDPDEDQDNVEAEDTEGTDDETDEVEAENEAEDQEAEDQNEEDPETVTVSMDDGTQLPLGELKKGYLRQTDYSRKTQEIANQRKTVEADTQRMQRITETFVEHLSKLIPDAPDVSLAYSEPDKYTAQKAQHEAAMAQVQSLMELAETPKAITDEMSKADLATAQQEANQRIIEMFPEAESGKGRQQFFEGVSEVAMELGFTGEELSRLSDSRVFALAHWAKKGMAAEKAKATAKAKVAKAPPAVPRKAGKGARKASGNADAMRKLSRSNRLEDALEVDWE